MFARLLVRAVLAPAALVGWLAGGAGAALGETSPVPPEVAELLELLDEFGPDERVEIEHRPFLPWWLLPDAMSREAGRDRGSHAGVTDRGRGGHTIARTEASGVGGSVAAVTDRLPPEPVRRRLERSLASLAEIPDAERAFRAGEEAFRQGRYEEALAAFARAHLLDRRNGLPRFGLALAHFALGEFADAAHHLRLGLAALPDFPRSGASLLGLYDRPGELRTHRRRLLEHLRAHPADRDAWMLLAFVDRLIGLEENARRIEEIVSAGRRTDAAKDAADRLEGGDEGPGPGGAR